MTTYEYIARNKRRTWLLVLLFPALFTLLMWGVFSFVFMLVASEPSAMTGDFYGLNTRENLHQLLLYLTAACWGLATLWMWVAYLKGDSFILRTVRATPVTIDQQPEVYRLVENLCITRGLPAPPVYILNNRSLNAFTVGRDPLHATLVLTQGIVDKLERTELEGVIAHELAHIENRDTLLMLMTVAGISCFTMAGKVLLCAGMADTQSAGKTLARVTGVAALLGVILMIYGYLLAPLVRLALTFTREYQADATAALTTRNPRALASALRKISRDCRLEIMERQTTMTPMCIANPIGRLEMGVFGALTGLSTTHPRIEKRIQALLDMDGGHETYL